MWWQKQTKTEEQGNSKYRNAILKRHTELHMVAEF